MSGRDAHRARVGPPVGETTVTIPAGPNGASSARDLAALDLGSNSFHLIIVRHRRGQLRVVDRLNEYVRLAGGLDRNNVLGKEKMDEALEALARIGQRLRHLEAHNVRVVGTNTLRRAKNARCFVTRAEAILGHAIEIISGKEEARLIYAGVSAMRASGSGNRLVVDIGGGSTELIIGSGLKPICMESLFMGCVSSAERFFPNRKVTATRMEHAILSASIELMPVVENYRRVGWTKAIGSSGSVQSVLKTVQEAGWCKNLVTARGLDRLTARLVELGECSPKTLPGLSERRAPVFAGGVAVLNACFRQLGIESMEVSDAALREGVIQDLIGRGERRDVRNESVEDLAHRYHVDTEQARRVEATATALFDTVAERWNLNPPRHRRLLSWAARLHEIGLDVSHHQYHKHGAYIIAFTDLPGFSLTDRAILSTLVRGHRRKLNALVFERIPDALIHPVERLVILLRLSVLLHRHRGPERSPRIGVEVRDKTVALKFETGWLRRHPLTHALFDEENDLIRGYGYRVEIPGGGNP